MQSIAFLPIFLCVLSSAILLGCAPSASKTTGEVAASTPAVAPSGALNRPEPSSRKPATTEDMQAFEQQIVAVHSDMLWVLQHMAFLEPERQKRLAPMMADLMAEETSLLVSMQPIAEAMTAAERQTSSTQVGRIVANVQDMQQLATSAPDPTKIPKLAPGDMSMVGEISRQMDQLHAEMLTNSEKLSIQQIEGIAANMVDLTGNLDRLKVPIGSGYGRLNPEQRRTLDQQLGAMRQITQQMVKAAS